MEDRRIHVMVDGKQQDLSLDKWNNNGGAQAFSKEFPSAEIRMRDNNGQDYSVPVSQFSNAAKKGLHMFTYSTTPVKGVGNSQPQTFQSPASAWKRATTPPYCPASARCTTALRTCATTQAIPAPSTQTPPAP